MLKSLRVQDLAVVEDVTLAFGPGLNILSGETGAGKSLLTGAIGLVIGLRASGTLVRRGAERARVEAVFEPRDPERIGAILDERGLPGPEDGWLIVRREVSADGRSRAFVGDAQVRVSSLRDLGEALVDLHGQGEHHRLLAPAGQLQSLDRFAEAEDVLGELAGLLDRERALGERIDAIRERREEIARQREYFEHQLQEIEAAYLEPDEEDALRQERRRLLEASGVLEAARAVEADLVGADGAALDRVAGALERLARLAELDPGLGPCRELLENARLEIEEAARTVRGRIGDFDFSPERRDEVERRLDVIGALTRKYARGVEDILAHADELRQALAADDAGDSDLEALRAERDLVRGDATRVADALGARRARAARALGRQVARALPELGMEKARFAVRIGVDEDPESWYARKGQSLRIGPNGAETIHFELAANPGETTGPLARVASGGERARVMLALGVELIAATPVDVMILDEVDAGIGGRTARAVAERMRLLAGERQVIAVTHLASVACAGAHHYRIEKTTEGRRTRVRVQPLDGDARVSEIARMLAGAEDDPTAREHARELLAATGHEGGGA